MSRGESRRVHDLLGATGHHEGPALDREPSQAYPRTVSEPLEQLIERARQRVGATLRRGKFRLERLLGVGAMGPVFAATHRNGMRVAIKIIHVDLARMESHPSPERTTE